MDPQVNPFAALSFIIAPAVLTNASSILTLSTSNRLARAVDLARGITSELESTPPAARSSAKAKLRDLATAQQRVLLLIRALRLFYVALGGFASAALLSLIGAVFAPSAPRPLTGVMEVVVLGAGVTGVASLVAGALSLVHETRLAVAALKERAANVQRQFRETALRSGDPSFTDR